MSIEKPTRAQEERLENVLGWARTAKENLPSINDSRVAADRIAQMSSLIDRLYQSAMRMRVQQAAGRCDEASTPAASAVLGQARQRAA